MIKYCGARFFFFVVVVFWGGGGRHDVKWNINTYWYPDNFLPIYLHSHCWQKTARGMNSQWAHAIIVIFANRVLFQANYCRHTLYIYLCNMINPDRISPSDCYYIILIAFASGRLSIMGNGYWMMNYICQIVLAIYYAQWPYRKFAGCGTWKLLLNKSHFPQNYYTPLPEWMTVALHKSFRLTR